MNNNTFSLTVKCRHPEGIFVNCYIDSKKINKKRAFGFGTIFNTKIDSQEHIITIVKRNIYDSPVCWFNIINPVFWVKQIRFATWGYDEAFSSRSFVITKSNDNKIPCLNLFLHNTSFNWEIILDGSNGVKIHKSTINEMPKKQVWRWRAVRIGSSVVMAAFVIFSNFSNLFSTPLENIVTTIAFSIFSIYLIYKVLKIKKVKKTGDG